jgi:hypothetical protein
LIRPALSRTDDERSLPAIQVFAKLFGKIMPFWMAETALLRLILLVVMWNWPAISTVLLLVATLLSLTIIIFSVVGASADQQSGQSLGYPESSARLAGTKTALGQLNAIRVVIIAAAFVALIGSYRTLGWH